MAESINWFSRFKSFVSDTFTGLTSPLERIQDVFLEGELGGSLIPQSDPSSSSKERNTFAGVVAGIAKKAGIPQPRVVMAESKMLNARAEEGLLSNRVGTTTGVVRLFSDADPKALEFVAGHEITHLTQKDDPYWVGALKGYAPGIANYFTRQKELQADEGGVKLTCDPDAAIRALTAMQTGSLHKEAPTAPTTSGGLVSTLKDWSNSLPIEAQRDLKKAIDRYEESAKHTHPSGDERVANINAKRKDLTRNCPSR